MRRIILSSLLLMGWAFGVHGQQLSAGVEETTPGQTWTMTFTLSGATDYTALSLKLSLPEQLQATSNIATGTALQTTHQTLIGPATDNICNVILYSPQSALLPAEDATFSIQLQLAEAPAEGEYTFTLSDIRLADAQGEETVLDDCNASLTVMPTGIPQLQCTPTKPQKLYDLRGRRVLRPAKGLIIRDGKKYYIR